MSGRKYSLALDAKAVDLKNKERGLQLLTEARYKLETDQTPKLAMSCNHDVIQFGGTITISF